MAATPALRRDPAPGDGGLASLGRPNTLIIGRYAGSAPVYQERALAILADNLARYLAGQPLRDRLGLSLGIRIR